MKTPKVVRNDRYFVSVFLYGKNLKMFFSTELSELAVIKSKYKDCEIEILDLVEFRRLSDAEIRLAIKYSYEDFCFALKRKRDGNIKNTSGETKS